MIFHEIQIEDLDAIFEIRMATWHNSSDALRWLMDADIPLDGASDHGGSEALTFAIPARTALNCIGIARPPSGHARPTGISRCSHGRSISSPCWTRGAPRPPNAEPLIARDF